MTETKGLKIRRYFSKQNVNPFDDIEWEFRTAKILTDNGDPVFEQKNIEVPKNWSQLATNVVASKYFFGGLSDNRRETSVQRLLYRVCHAIRNYGIKDGYFATEEDADIFYDELAWLCLHQYGSFNSPVWFNVGIYDTYGIKGQPNGYHWDKASNSVVPSTSTYAYPQVSACFIQSVKDSMDDIMRLATSEAMLFKHGSGTGTDLSTLRSSKEKLSGGGRPSGPLSFMRVYDQIAAVIKSGGKTRRAAKLQSLRIDHPDIKEFITCKAEEEEKVQALIDAGYSPQEAYNSVMYQNANLSVRLTDEFMKAVEEDAEWWTYGVTDKKKYDRYSARELFRLIAESTRLCGDPGMQFDTTINNWNTCANSGRINSSNPCSEFMALDDTACNLASLNLMKFRTENGCFDDGSFQKAVRIFIIAQDILIDNGSYPEKSIAENSHKFRPLGLGFANLGALIMSMGYAYDSDEAREEASVISTLMTNQAYDTSLEMAQCLGAFEEYEKNKDCMLKVLKEQDIFPDMLDEAKDIGFRNSQVTLVAPTGTIGFMMDCDTTGIEPDISLVKYKTLSDGGLLKLINSTVPMALKCLEYSETEIDDICRHLANTDSIEKAPHLKSEHLGVFDCAFKPRNGERFIHYMAHLKMMAAVQPYISGAISKTINMPKESTTEDIMQAYMEGWKMGLKSVAIYRDGSKKMQPVNVDRKEEKSENKEAASYRKRLPDTRNSLTHKFSVAGHEGYMTVGLYEDGQPGELFISMAKEGSTVGGLMDAIGICTSMALQYGVPIAALVEKFRFTRFEPSGMTGNEDIPFAKSLIDYIFCWLGCRFIEGYAKENTVQREPEEKKEIPTTKGEQFIMNRFNQQFRHFGDDAPACDICGSITVRNGTCYKCFNCGNSMGCS